MIEFIDTTNLILFAIIFWIIFFFIWGALTSFWFAMYYRYIENRWKNIEKFPIYSQCETCKTRLNFIQLIPVFWYILYKWKCPICKYKVPIKYPIYEFLWGIIFIIFWFLFLYILLKII